jgi:hypothetical protein
MSFVDDVERVVQRHANVADGDLQRAQIDDALGELCGPESGGILWRRYRTYAVEMGRVATRIERYRWLRSLEIVAAPEVIAKFAIADDRHVIVLRYWATREGEDLIPATTDGVSFTQRAGAQLMRDLETLGKHGQRHLYVGRGLNYWSVGAESGVITLHGWTSLVEGGAGEDLAAVSALLASRTGSLLA